MSEVTTGIVQGGTVILDRRVPLLDGHRVRVVLEPIDESEIELTAEQNRRLLEEWATKGDQGPIDADDTLPEED